jgi:hypothetical protein
VLGEERICEFRLEKDDQPVFFFFPSRTVNRDQVKQIDLSFFVRINLFYSLSVFSGPTSPDAIIFL